MKRFKIIIKTKNKSYPIIIGENILNKTGNLINAQIPSCKKIALIIDSKVPKKIVIQVKNSIKNFDNLYIKLNTSEKIKNLKIVSELINKLLKFFIEFLTCTKIFFGTLLSMINAIFLQFGICVFIRFPVLPKMFSPIIIG